MLIAFGNLIVESVQRFHFGWLVGTSVTERLLPPSPVHNRQ